MHLNCQNECELYEFVWSEAVSVILQRTGHYTNHPLRKRVLQMKEMSHQQSVRHKD